MDQGFGSPAVQDDRKRSTAQQNSQIYQAERTASGNTQHTNYHRSPMTTVGSSLDYPGSSGSEGTSGQADNHTSLIAPSMSDGDEMNHPEALMQYGDDGGQRMGYLNIAASETRSFSETPFKQPKPLTPAQSPVGRHLPLREITDQTLDDAYIAFILYCNPAIPISTDSTELRKVLRTPPKSDGKSFSTFKLFELIRKLEHKEIRTWTQLAIQLGVEPPAAEKNQSAQKVQQYAVRLKVSLCSFYFMRRHVSYRCVSSSGGLVLDCWLLTSYIAMDESYAC